MAIQTTETEGLGAQLRPLGFGTSQTGATAAPQPFASNTNNSAAQSGQASGLGTLPLTLEDSLSNALAAPAGTDINDLMTQLEGNTGSPSDVDQPDISTFSMAGLQAGQSQTSVLSKAQIPAVSALAAFANFMFSLEIASRGGAPGEPGGPNPGPGTGGPSASSPAGGSQAASGSAPGTGDAASEGTGGGGGGGGSCVICTEMYEQRKISKRLFLSTYKAGADLSDDYLRGYHFWAVPLVTVLKKKGTVSKITFFFAERWMKHSAYTVGWAKKDNLIGYAMHKTFVPINICLGKLIRGISNAKKTNEAQQA